MPSIRTASVSSLRRESQHSVGLGGRIFTNSMLEGGRFANDVIGMVAAGDLHSTGSITGEFASQALSSYMGITAQGDTAPQISGNTRRFPKETVLPDEPFLQQIRVPPVQERITKLSESIKFHLPELLFCFSSLVLTHESDCTTASAILFPTH